MCGRESCGACGCDSVVLWTCFTMGVPRHFQTSTENSTRLSYDDAYIQKIPSKTDRTLGPSVVPTYKPTPRYFNGTTERTNSYSDRDRAYIRKRFQELFNNTYLLNSDFPWLSSTNITNDYSSLYQIPLPSKIDVVIRRTPTWKYYLSAPTIIFLVLAVLKLFLYYQRLPRTDIFSRRRLSEERQRPSDIDTDPEPPNEIGPQTVPTTSIIIDPEFSTQNNSIFDLPPSYSQCAIDNIETGNKTVENISEDMPPPYFTCIETLNGTDDIPKVHKGQSGEEQSHTDTDIHLNNLHTANSNNVDQSDSTASPLNTTVETTTGIDEFNTLIESNNGTNYDNAAKNQPRSSS